MASPKYEPLFIFNINTGVGIAGTTFTFEVYKDSDGLNLTAPTVVEIGGGAYGFIPTFTANKGIFYVLRCNHADANPKRLTRYIRPEDYSADGVDVAVASVQADTDAIQADLAVLDTGSITSAMAELTALVGGKWEIKTSGPDINHLIIYAADGTTVLKKFLLTDRNGVPTVTNPFKRTPVV